MIKSILSCCRRVFDAVLGPVRWSPPRWLASLAESGGKVVKNRPGAVGMGILLLGLAGWGGWKWWEWREAERARQLAWEEAHRARPDVVEVKIYPLKVEVSPGAEPERTQEGYRTPALRLSFDRDAAPLLAAGVIDPEGDAAGVKPPARWVKDEVKDIAMEPPHPGVWRWESLSQLVFQPSAPWPSDVKFSLHLKDSLAFQSGVKLDRRQYDYRTAAFGARVTPVEFYTDPRNPALHQVVAELRFSHPVETSEVEKFLRFDAVGGSPLFQKDGKPVVAAYSLLADNKDPNRHFWARSVPLTIPEKEDFARVTLRPGMTIPSGGKPIEKEVVNRVRVPDVTSGFEIKSVESRLARNGEGDPSRILLVETRGFATLDDLTAAMEVAALPPKPGDNPVWQSAGEVVADTAVKPVPVKFSGEPDEETFTQRHAFRLESVAPGQMLVTIKKGLKSQGGFILPSVYQALVTAPDFPSELSFASRGGLLALNGERKLAVKARGVSHIRYTLARVLESQINHLVSMTGGNFESPYFRGGNFGKENIARVRREVVKLESPGPLQAVWSSFDFAPATSEESDGVKGLFFLSAESVKPREKGDASEPGEAEEEDGRSVSPSDDPDWVRQEVSPPPGSEEENDRGWNNGPSRFVLVTDLGLLVKQNADGSRDVFVQSVSQGGPVAGVEVSVLAKNGDAVAAATTDGEGHVLIASVAHLQREMSPVALVAKLGRDLAFMPWNRADRRLDFSRFDTAGVLASEAKALDAFLFSERGIYRPGDKAHLGIAVRPRGWEGSTEGVPVVLSVRNAAGRICHEANLRLPADGFLETTVPLREEDPTGIYTASLSLPDEKHGELLGRMRFRVEDFQPDRMKLAVTLPGSPAAGWRTSSDIKAVVALKTLFGFAAAGRRVTGKLHLSRASFSFAEFPDYQFYAAHTADTRLPENPEVSLGEMQTGEEGSGEFDLQFSRWAGASIEFTFAAEAFEADGGRSVGETVSGLYSPLERVVGFKADGDLNYISKDAPRSVRFVCVGSNGRSVAAPALTIRILENRNHSVLTRQDNGNYAYTSTLRTTTVMEKPFDIPADGAGFVLPVDRTGQFTVQLVDAAQSILCQANYAVAGKGESGRSLEQNAELEMKLARGDWQSGEEIECSLSAPFTGAGLITIEREKVLGWKWFRSGTTDSVQKIRVPDGLEGGAYVSASFVRALDSQEVFMSPLSYAVEPFRANAGKRRNELKLEVPPVVVPGSVMKIGITSARPSRAVVYAVDEGIHQITKYQLPGPLDFFLRQRALEVETLQILDLVMPEFTVLGRSRASGGDGEEEGAVSMVLNPFKRRKEPPVVYWSGIIETGPALRELEYTVPDYFAGQLTIMAVAAGGAQLGETQTKCLVRGPFVLTPNAPLFAAPGDSFTASLTIANNTDGSGSGPVRATLEGSENLEIAASPEPLAIAQGKEATVRFLVKAREPLGNATMTFRVEAGGVSSARQTTLSIRPATPRLTTLQSGWFRLPEHRVKPERQLFPEFASRKTSVSSLPLNLAGGLEAWLHEFPHGCTEQLTSRAMARTLLSGEASFGFDRATAAAEMDAVFTVLRSRQLPDGGFGLWGRTGDGGIEGLTPYVAHFLTEAKEAGFAVPPDVMREALKRLKSMAAIQPADRRQEVNLARAIYVLTRNGEVTTNYLLNLRDLLQKNQKDQKDAWQKLDAAPWMASSWALLKMEKEARDTMEVWWEDSRKRASGAWQWYDEQPLAVRALGLMLLSRHFPGMAGTLNYDDLKPLTQGIERSEFNTYSAASVVMALKAWSALHKSSNIFTSLHEIRAGAGPVLLTPVGSGVVSADFSAAAEAVQFGLIRPQGAPDLGAYYQMVESGFDRELPQQPVTRGLEVHRWFVLNGRRSTSLKVGESAGVEIELQNLTGKVQRDLALVDLLPCGFEIEGGSLVPGPGHTPGADSVDIREDRNLFYCSLLPGASVTFTYRVKPVCAGEFVLPPASASSMYDRAVFGSGAAARITVLARE